MIMSKHSEKFMLIGIKSFLVFKKCFFVFTFKNTRIIEAVLSVNHS